MDLKTAKILSSGYFMLLKMAWEQLMPQGKMAKKHRSRWFNTTVGEFVEAVYEAAMEEYMDEVIARRIAMQMLIRKLRMQHKLNHTSQAKQKKKAYLRSEIKKNHFKKS